MPLKRGSWTVSHEFCLHSRWISVSLCVICVYPCTCAGVCLASSPHACVAMVAVDTVCRGQIGCVCRLCLICFFGPDVFAFLPAAHQVATVWNCNHSVLWYIDLTSRFLVLVLCFSGDLLHCSWISKFSSLKSCHSITPASNRWRYQSVSVFCHLLLILIYLLLVVKPGWNCCKLPLKASEEEEEGEEIKEVAAAEVISMDVAAAAFWSDLDGIIEWIQHCGASVTGSPLAPIESLKLSLPV